MSTSAARRFSPRRALHLIAAAAAALLLLGSTAAAGHAADYDPSDFRVPANAPVSAALIASLGGGVEAADVGGGWWSGDRSRILFVLGAATLTDEDDALWVMRADGTQRTKLAQNSYYATADDPTWVDDDTVRWFHESPYLHDSSGDQWRTVTPTGSADAWAPEPKPGYVTLDGRYLVDKADRRTYYGWAEQATDLASGQRFVVKQHPNYTDTATRWHPACRLPDGDVPSAQLSVEDALRGHDPVCDFGALRGTPAPVPATTLDYGSDYYVPLPASDPVPDETLRELLADRFMPSLLADGVWSPDRRRIAFRVRNALKPELARGGTIWAARADGSEPHQLGAWNAADGFFYDGDPRWLDRGTVTWTAYSIRKGATRDITKRLTVGEVEGITYDAWNDATPTLRGRATVDGRYRVIKTWPDASGATSVSVIVLATGAEHWLWSSRGTDDTPAWSVACTLRPITARWATPTVEDALRGPDPMCDFGRGESLATPTPAPSPVATPAPPAVPRVVPTPTPPPAPDATPAPVAPPRTPLATRMASPVGIVSLARGLKAARTKGLRLRLSSTSPVEVKVWLLDEDGRSVASRSIAKLPSGATTITLPRAPKLPARAAAVTVRIAAVEPSGLRTTVEREAKLG